MDRKGLTIQTMKDEHALVSIHPEWVRAIASGKKKYEVRKTRLHLKPPFGVYVYCTMGGEEIWLAGVQGQRESYCMNGTVCMEFTCDRIEFIDRDSNGMMFRQHWLDNDPDVRYFRDHPELLRDTCLTEEELRKYLGLRIGYAWHISDVKVFETPENILNMSLYRCINKLTMPPQGVIYVNPIDKDKTGGLPAPQNVV